MKIIEFIENVCTLYGISNIYYYFQKVDLESAGLFRGKKTSLHRLMREMGFGYRRVNNKCNYYEQPRIIEQRHSYLWRMRRNRIEKRPVVYLDETWCNEHHGKELAWVEKDTVTGGTLGGVK